MSRAIVGVIAGTMTFAAATAALAAGNAPADNLKAWQALGGMGQATPAAQAAVSANANDPGAVQREVAGSYAALLAAPEADDKCLDNGSKGKGKALGHCKGLSPD